MDEYSIDPDAVTHVGRDMATWVDPVEVGSWPLVDTCEAEVVADAMAQLREWFVAEWASLDWEVTDAGRGAMEAARVLGGADDTVARTTASAPLTMRAV